MAHYPKNARLPDDPIIKDINAYKKKINWGEIPAFFHMIANSVAEAEGFIDYGFDNAYKRIVNRKNWNYDNLGIDTSIQVDHIELLQPLHKPKICIHHVFNPKGYELIALPYVKDVLIDEYRSGDPNMDFTIWDPSHMKVLARVPQLHKFIAFNHHNGDDADMALIAHAYNVMNKIISMLDQEVNVYSIKGMSIKDIYGKQSSNPELGLNDLIKSQIENTDL